MVAKAGGLVGEGLIVTADPMGEAARLLGEAIRASDASRGGTRFAITGGSAARALGLLTPAIPNDVWKRVSLTWIDERRVPFESPESNRGEAYRQGWLSKDRPPEFELPLWLDDATPERAVKRVRKAVEQTFLSKLDLAFYGIGEDGHIASLFPGHPARFARGPVVTLDDSPKPPPERITLTYELLRTARVSILLGMGESKRAALERVLSGDPLAPANALPELTIVTDLDLKRAS
jgi:6-phosphogluconolactonase